MVMRATNQSLTEAELNDLMAELDVDLTGTLSFDELCIFVGHRIGGHKLQLAADEFLHSLDQDGDGKLSISEVQHILQHFDAFVNNEHVQEIFQALKTTQAQYISLSELTRLINPSGGELDLTSLLE
ncbi:hypothetical protein AHF37_07197 [Paragonimus kellicotti]|nr:hypothetical protein AHF37_07197 [Paragonimus kellicotti]